MSPTAEIAPLHALIVDADAIFRRRLSRGLVDYGLDAVALGSIEEALAAIGTRTPDVLVLGPRLLDPSGLQLADALRSDRICSTLIIALAESADGPPAPAADRFDAFLVKPCSVEEVMERIDQLFQTKIAFATAS